MENKKKVLLKVENAGVSINDKSLVKGVSFEIKQGEIVTLIGPNGSGKSTTSNVLAGKPGYEISDGSIQFFEEDIIDLAPDERVSKGLFLAFQYPVEIPGVSNTNFLRTAMNSILKMRGQDKMSPSEFLSKLKTQSELLGIDQSMLKRSVNLGFSGGEKKRNEVLQMLTLEPELSILDETDSGLDIDALKIIADGVNKYRSPERSFLVITHYQRLLKYIEPDVVHVLIDGKIVRSGGKELAIELEEKGYGWLES